MKIQNIILLLFLVGCCVSNAQPTNLIVICTTTNQPTLLTKEQATLLAIRLADEKVEEIPNSYNSRPAHHVFENSLSDTNYISNGKLISAGGPIYLKVESHFEEGHWVFNLYTDDNGFDYIATVELAADGSTNTVRNLKSGRHIPSPLL